MTVIIESHVHAGEPVSEPIRNALKKITQAGYQVNKTGFDFLSHITDEATLDKLIQYSIDRANVTPEGSFILDHEFFSSLLEEMTALEMPSPKLTPKTKEVPIAREYEPIIEIRKDPTEEASSNGTAQDFLNYFRDRYDRIEKIFKKRLDTRDAVPIAQALKAPPKNKNKVVGIITNRRSSENRLFIDIEDKESSATILVSSNSDTMRVAQELLLDQIACFEVAKFKEGLLVADSINLAQVPEREPRRSSEPLCAALISDLHVGSKLFIDKLLNKFVRWLNMDLGDEGTKQLAGAVKYIVIAGDLVDGIGVYPEQEGELAITNIETQYKTVESLLSGIPDYVHLVIIPGNHDAVRKSLPQPAISKKYTERLSNDGRTRLLGDPSTVALHGVEFLISHGKSLDDVLTQVPGLDFHQPAKGMELLLRARHVSPIYGSTTPIAPQTKDWMVIESPPDVLDMGHIHIPDSKRYRDTVIINSGTWQSQTSYQKRMGLVPIPGKIPLVDLQTLHVRFLDFNDL